MATGLKQLIEAALGESATDKPPVEVSVEARLALSRLIRDWSGWPKARVVFGKTDRGISPWAVTDVDEQSFTIDPDELILNPNRVLLTVTPFRLKQEAVMTGVLLHEAGHARHSHWVPDNWSSGWVHGSYTTHEGEPVTRQTVALARLMEEARVEGLMIRNAENIGAAGLAWTMRAAGAALLPTTNLSTDPDQQIMDLLSSWAVRSAKHLAVGHWDKNYRIPHWVNDLTALLHTALLAHLMNNGDDNPARTAQKIVDQLLLMAVCVEDRSTYMVDCARDVLDMLFPETPAEDMPSPVDIHNEAGQSEDAGNSDNEESEAGGEESTGEGDESGEQGEGNTEPEDEGSGDDPGAGDSGEDEEAEPKPVSDPSDTGDEDGEGDGEPEDSDTEGGTQAQQDTGEADTTSDLAKDLAALEAQSKGETEDEAEQLSETSGDGAGQGEGGEDSETWRMPTKEERDIQQGAEKFLRDMIAPTENSTVRLTDTPSSTIDGAAYEAWNAGGRIRAPHFFKQTRRVVEPSPPVKIAVLVDVSSSMEEMQAPSAVLSWSLASAALDLRNFAGRGQQIESCLIHWGSRVDVIQKVGEPLPGLREYPCNQGTSVWAGAMEAVEDQMPGFFDVPMTPVNRLLVNFTDWDFLGNRHSSGGPKVWATKALESGVNLINVVPQGWGRGYGANRGKDNYKRLMSGPIQRGRIAQVKYNPSAPGLVWDTAAEILNGGTPAPFSGF